MITKIYRGIRHTYRDEGLRPVIERSAERAVDPVRHVPSAYWRIAPRWYRFVHSFDTDEYLAPLDPYKLVRIDPSEVSRFSGREYPPWSRRTRSFGAVEPGEWDRRTPEPRGRYEYHGELYVAETFERSTFHRSMVDRFENGTPWAETPFVRGLVEWLDRREKVWHGCETEDEVLERCRSIDELYRTIREEGYLTQRELAVREGNSGRFLKTLENELVLDVGRDGEPLFVSGRHRLSIAKILELPSVPAVFLVRHPDWMVRRDAWARRGTPLDHPDLEEL